MGGLATLLATAAALTLLTLTGCKVGPNYHTPPAILAPTNTYKEAPPSNLTEGWTQAQPADTQLKGDWWTMFDDAELNQLEPQVDTANQTLKAAEANFRAARAQIGYARSFEAPTLGVAPVAGAIRDSANQPYFNVLAANNGDGNFELPIDFNYEIDLWGNIRRGVTQARANAQAADANLESVRLSLHAELALDYMHLRSDDAQEKLFNDTIQAYEHAVQLTQDRYQGGVAPESDVTQAQTQLQQAEVERTDLQADRSANEHAIAVLIGKPPSELTIAPVAQLTPNLPSIPGVLPAQLLQRRPDIASAERTMAAANEAIGIAQAAYYPQLSLSATGGYLGTSAVNLFSIPSLFYAIGPTLSETFFDYGRRHSVKAQAMEQYNGEVANYRQTALTAFQQVEDNLAALRILENEAAEQHEATASAEKSLQLFNYRYEGGVDTYLQVITWQTAALNDERNDIVIEQRRLEASILLIKALGGGWNATSIPHL
jgi:NodT family efflux transporter outer membrane factor (OMF) lipoprotein